MSSPWQQQISETDCGHSKSLRRNGLAVAGRCRLVQGLTNSFLNKTPPLVAVGTVIADRPPHRSRRALLTHRAPPSGRTSAACGLKPPDVRRTAANRIDVVSRLGVRTTAACRVFPSGEALPSTTSAGSWRVGEPQKLLAKYLVRRSGNGTQHFRDAGAYRGMSPEVLGRVFESFLPQRQRQRNRSRID